MKRKLPIILTVSAIMATYASPALAMSYEYDNLGRITSIIYDSGQLVNYTYDPAGNLTSETFKDTTDSGSTPPNLNLADGDIVIGQPITVEFTDDAGWKDSITGVNMDETALSTSQYTITTNSITITPDTYQTPGNHTILIKANRFNDASIKVKVNEKAKDTSIPELSINNTTTDEIELIWGTVDGAIKYKIYRSTSETGKPKLIGTSTTTNYSDTDLTPNMVYYYKVNAVTASNEGKQSKAVMGTTNGLAPIIETLTVGNISNSELQISLSTPLLGLKADNFTITDSLGKAVKISKVATPDNGTTYTINAKLDVEQIYYITAVKDGYSFKTLQNTMVPQANTNQTE